MPTAVLTASLFGLWSCAQAPPEPVAPAGPAAPPPPRLTEITLSVLTVATPFRWDTELRGLATTLLELGLNDLPGVYVRVPGDAPPPVWALNHPRAEQQFAGTFTASGNGESLTLVLALCETTGTKVCETHGATGSREAPHPMIATLLEAAAVQLGRTVDEATMTAWATPGSKDNYAELITGRGCATYLGMLPPPVDPSDKRQNSVLRAIFVDPKQPVAQWMWARWQVYALAGAGTAADTLRRAALLRPTSPVILADLATTLSLTGKVDEAAIVWQGLAEQAPTDPRWMTPYADTLLELGRPLEARAVLEHLPSSFHADPRHAELQVRIAEQTGHEDLDPLLARWQATAPTAPEPVRRRIQQRVADGKYADALSLMPALRSRAPGSGSDALEVALLTATGQLDAAADRAPREVALRLRARAARESDPASEPALDGAVAALAIADARLWSNKPGPSIEAADRALRLQPGADAWSARARALEAAGRTEESVQSWQEAWQLDPAIEGGPVAERRIASTFRLAVPEPAPVEPEDELEGPNMGMEE